MRRKKVGILTLVLHSNFGYLLQAYALQQIVRRLGHDPYTYQIWEESPNLRKKIVIALKNVVAKYVFRRHDAIVFRRYITSKERSIIDQYTRTFINENLQLSPCLKNISKIVELKNEYDVCIVGSDQVWRRWYAPHIQSYFFSFLPNNIKRISYAASFGLSDILYSKKQKKECGKALKLFSGISVREEEGIDICKKEWGINAECVLDPTLLLKKEDYMKLITADLFLNIPTKPYLLCYILDETDEKMNFISKVADSKGLLIWKIKPKAYNGDNDIDSCIYPPVSMWLESFNKADFVITDSFHGTAFSIIFEKQFMAIGNKERGISRFTTLLNGLNLNNRLITEIDNSALGDNLIDYDKVNLILAQRVKKSTEFISRFLNDEN